MMRSHRPAKAGAIARAGELTLEQLDACMVQAFGIAPRAVSELRAKEREAWLHFE